MPEDIPSISSSRLTGAELARHSFATVRRGFDPQEVRSFLELVARELSAAEQREEELRRQASGAEERARNPVIDESTLKAALGQQSAQVLRNAHEEAARIALQAEETAAALVREAQRLAAELQVQAEAGAAERTAEAEIAHRAVLQQAEAEALALLEASRAEAEALVARAIDQGQEMIEQAQESRRRVLADMAQRRRAMTMQIEQFRAARDELAAAVMGLRDSVDAIVGDLAHADDAARAAAAEVARRQPAEHPATELMAEIEEAVAALDAAAPAPAAGGRTEEPGAAEVEVTTAIFDVEVEDPDTGTTVVEEIEVVVVEEAGEGGAEEPADDVEGLFARLRAVSGDEAAQPEEPADEDADRQAQPPAAPDAAAEAEGPGADDGGEGEEAEPDPDEPLRAVQEAVLDPIAAQLAKRLKRALQDDQNHLLDRLRSGSGAWSAGTLPPEEEQRALYVDAASGSLKESVAAGIAFAREQRGERGGRPPAPDAKAVAELAERLAGTVVGLLRRRLEDEDGGAADGAERVGAAYRDWRGARIERLVGDYAVEGFSAGVLAAAGTGGALRWVLAGGAPACADCDDNALAGAVAAGEEFPTGHRHPPAHAGCRCLVVPTPA
jgi:DivIVA domain-containing protein